MKIRPLVSLALFGAAACQPDQQNRSGPATESRDSSGIRIVENAKPRKGSRVWRVASEPAVSIGEQEGEDPYLLYQVWDATKLPDGRSKRGLNPDRKSSNYLQDCTICASCRCTGPCWTEPPQREKRLQSAGAPSVAQ